MTVRDAINKSIDREFIEDAVGIIIIDNVTQIMYRAFSIKEYVSNIAIKYSDIGYDDIIEGIIEGLNDDEDYEDILDWEYVDYAYSDEKVIFIYVNREDY